MTKHPLLKLLGALCMLGGIILAAVGLADFFGMSAWMDGRPEHFWLALVGFPLFGIGGMLLAFGFHPEIERRAMARAAKQMKGITASRCPACGEVLARGANFCHNCGKSL